MGMIKNLLTVAGGAAGAYLGGGVGGASIGASLGNALGDIADPQKEFEHRIQKQQVGPVETSMSRRKFQLDQIPLRQIRESIDSLKYVNNDAMRMELAKPLLEAEYMAKAKV